MRVITALHHAVKRSSYKVCMSEKCNFITTIVWNGCYQKQCSTKSLQWLLYYTNTFHNPFYDHTIKPQYSRVFLSGYLFNSVRLWCGNQVHQGCFNCSLIVSHHTSLAPAFTCSFLGLEPLVKRNSVASLEDDSPPPVYQSTLSTGDAGTALANIIPSQNVLETQPKSCFKMGFKYHVFRVSCFCIIYHCDLIACIK